MGEGEKTLKACPSCHGAGVVLKPGTHNDLKKCETCNGERVR